MTSKPVATLANQFTTNLASGKVAEAQAQCESTVTPEELQECATLVQSWGTFQDLTLPVRNVDKSNGQTTWDLQGIATFNGVQKKAAFKLHKQADGTYKLFSVSYQ